jgi:hypothetical protein
MQVFQQCVREVLCRGIPVGPGSVYSANRADWRAGTRRKDGVIEAGDNQEMNRLFAG